MPKFLAIASLAAVLLLPAVPAVAESSDDWLSSVFTAKQERPTIQRTATATAQKRSTRPTRVAKVDDTDDGSRPQRNAASKPRPRRDLSGEGGQTGVASYYWEPQALASGGRFNPNAMTAAHKTLPFGTRVRVTRVDNGNSVDVVINDRGPYIGGRIIDLSRRAAQNLNMTGAGVAKVRVAILGRG